VKDYVIDGTGYDAVLDILVDTVILSIASNRAAFPDPRNEPVMYTHFSRWVSEGLNEAREAREALSPV